VPTEFCRRCLCIVVSSSSCVVSVIVVNGTVRWTKSGRLGCQNCLPATHCVDQRLEPIVSSTTPVIDRCKGYEGRSSHALDDVPPHPPPHSWLPCRTISHMHISILGCVCLSLYAVAECVAFTLRMQSGCAFSAPYTHSQGCRRQRRAAEPATNNTQSLRSCWPPATYTDTGGPSATLLRCASCNGQRARPCMIRCGVGRRYVSAECFRGSRAMAIYNSPLASPVQAVKVLAAPCILCCQKQHVCARHADPDACWTRRWRGWCSSPSLSCSAARSSS
jgi:hypothetical protein